MGDYQAFMPHIAPGEHGNVWSALKKELLPKIESGERPSINGLLCPHPGSTPRSVPRRRRCRAPRAA